ncbi:MAG: hypothetical protein QW084_01270 [Candidatus Hadarchaeales archaeon]
MIGTIFYMVAGVLALLLPGLLLSLVAYPRKEQLDLSSRLAMSFGLGILLILYLGFFLAKANLLSASPFFLSLLLMCAGLFALAFLRGAYPLSSVRRLLERPRKEAVDRVQGEGSTGAGGS